MKRLRQTNPSLLRGNDDAIAMYLREIGRVPLLSALVLLC